MSTKKLGLNPGDSGRYRKISGENKEKTQGKRGDAPGLLSEHIGETPDRKIFAHEGHEVRTKVLRLTFV
jgi:hypothetical protein